MKVLISRTKEFYYFDKDNKKRKGTENIKKIVPIDVFDRLKNLDINEKEELKWVIIKKFKKGEKISKDILKGDIPLTENELLTEKIKQLEKENEKLKKKEAVKKEIVKPENEKLKKKEAIK